MRKNKTNTKDLITLIILIAAVAMLLGGIIWGNVSMYIAEWDKALSRSDKFHIWLKLGCIAALGFVLLVIFNIRIKK